MPRTTRDEIGHAAASMMKTAVLAKQYGADIDLEKVMVHVSVKDLYGLISEVRLLRERQEEADELKRVLTGIKFDGDIEPYYQMQELADLIDFTMGTYEKILAKILKVDMTVMNHLYDGDGNVEQAMEYNLRVILETADIELPTKKD